MSRACTGSADRRRQACAILIHGSRLHQEEVHAVASEFANHRQVGRDDGNTGGHAFENLERAATLNNVAIVQGERCEHCVGDSQVAGQYGLRQGRQHGNE